MGLLIKLNFVVEFFYRASRCPNLQVATVTSLTECPEID